MQLTLFGATGALGNECLSQALDAGHAITVLARSPDKLPAEVRTRVDVVEGDALDGACVEAAIPSGTEAILFAIGIDKHSPEDLCATATRHAFDAMAKVGARRFVWCGGGSTLHDADQITFGARFVEFFARTFMGLRHRDKAHQLAFLETRRDIEWVGLRPLQMNPGPRRDDYRIGYDRFSGLSKITFADCAHGMLRQLDDDTWLHQAPIIQY